MRYFFAFFCLFLFSAEAISQTTGQMRMSGSDLQVYDGSTWDTVNHGGGSGGGCTAGQMRYTASRVEFCRAGAWRTTDSGTTDGGCSTAGQVRRDGGEIQFCNGSTWRVMNPSVVVVNGVCGAAASGSCTTSQPGASQCSAGSYADTGDTGAHWQWYCNGSGGGASPLCQRARCQNCSATTISNCTLSATSHGGSTGACASGYTGSCSYSCNNGSFSVVSNSCAVSSGTWTYQYFTTEDYCTPADTCPGAGAPSGSCSPLGSGCDYVQSTGACKFRVNYYECQ